MKVEFEDGTILELLTENNQKTLCVVKNERDVLLKTPINNLKYISKMFSQFHDYMENN
jgi:hypothetical protein